MKIKSLVLILMIGSQLFGQGQDSLEVNRLGQLNYPFRNLNDIWGYADAAGNEYALVGAESGFSIVDVTTPATPVEKVWIPGVNSVWRDIKTYSHYAYVVHDFSGPNTDGILIVDMDSVNQATPKFKNFIPTVMLDTVSFVYHRSHNIYIDENGVLYVFGASFGGGGALMFDLTADPENPSYLGIFDTYYLHDGMVRGDTLWGSAINNGLLVAIDVSDKTAPVIIGSIATPNNFTHNAWVSDDNNTVYTTDEKPGSYITAFDVSDATNMQQIDKLRVSYDANPDTVIPHNTHVIGDFLVTSYYTAGMHIIDATIPNVLVETAYYDTSPFTGSGYNGSWGAYPYLPSGNILSTDRQQGLFILHTDYPKACYLTGLVKDSVTTAGIPNAQLEFLSAPLNFDTDIFGKFATGLRTPGVYQVVVSKAGYRNDTISVNLSQGVETVRTIALLPFDFSLANTELGIEIQVVPNPSSGNFQLNLPKDVKGGIGELSIVSLSGKLVFKSEIDLSQKTTLIEHNLSEGHYVLQIKSADLNFQPTKILVIE